MKRITMTAAVFVIVSAFIAQANPEALTSDPETLKNQLIARHGSIHASQIKYFTIEDNFPEWTDKEAENLAREIEWMAGALDRMKNGIAPEKGGFFDGKTPEEIEAIIHHKELRLANEPLETIRTYSSMGSKIRVDVDRMGSESMNFYLLFDGGEGYSITYDGVVRRGSMFTRYFTGFMGFSRFGAGIAEFLDGNAKIGAIDPETNRVTVKTYHRADTPSEAVFTMLENEPLVWRTCEIGGWEGSFGIRFVCEDFVDIAGVKVPRTVYKQKPRLIKGDPVIHNDLTMTLIEARFNGECEFPEGFFDVPGGPETVVRLMER